MKVKLIKNSFIAKKLKVDGIILYPFIFLADPRPSVKTINHELVHILQIKRDGVFRFYFTYIKQYFQYRLRGLNHHQAYLTISYELEAYRHQNDLTYTGLWSIEYTA